MKCGMREIAIIVLLGLQTAPSFSAEGVPEQLRGQSIVLSWTESRAFEPIGDGGQAHGDTLYGAAKIYVSTHGNIFGRQERRIVITNSALAKSFSSEDAARKEGNYVQWEFDHDLLAGNIVNTQGVKRVSVSFTGQYKKCQLNIIYGKPGGKDSFVVEGWAHEHYVLRSAEISDKRCVVQSGNVLGGAQ